MHRKQQKKVNISKPFLAAHRQTGIFSSYKEILGQLKKKGQEEGVIEGK